MEFGIVAAAAQFVDLGCRSLFGLYRFLKQIRDVPNDLLRTLQDLSHFLELMTKLQSASIPTIDDCVPSPPTNWSAPDAF